VKNRLGWPLLLAVAGWVTAAAAAEEVVPIYPADLGVLESKKLGTEVVEFWWMPVKNTKFYTIRIWSNDSRDKTFEFRTRKTRKQLNVPTGRQYFWQVTCDDASEANANASEATASDAIASDLGKNSQNPLVFSFTLKGPQLIRPTIIEHQLTPEGVRITWRAGADGKEHFAKLHFRHLDVADYHAVKEESVAGGIWDLGTLKAGAYKMELVAQAPQRRSSDPDIYEFVIKPTPEDLKPLLRSGL